MPPRSCADINCRIPKRGDDEFSGRRMDDCAVTHLMQILAKESRG